MARWNCFPPPPPSSSSLPGAMRFLRIGQWHWFFRIWIHGRDDINSWRASGCLRRCRIAARSRRPIGRDGVGWGEMGWDPGRHNWISKRRNKGRHVLPIEIIELVIDYWMRRLIDQCDWKTEAGLRLTFVRPSRALSPTPAWFITAPRDSAANPSNSFQLLPTPSNSFPTRPTLDIPGHAFHHSAAIWGPPASTTAHKRSCGRLGCSGVRPRSN